MPETTELPTNLTTVSDLTTAVNDRIRQTNSYLATEFFHLPLFSGVNGDFGNQRAVNMADPTDDLDGVNLRTLKKYQSPGASNVPVVATQQVPITFGLDDDTVGTNVAGKYGIVWVPGRPVAGYISVVGLPSTGNMTLDVLCSKDKGFTWNSIFPATAGKQAVFPKANPNFLVTLGPFLPGLTFSLGTLLRCDSLVSGGCTGIELVIIYQSV